MQDKQTQPGNMRQNAIGHFVPVAMIPAIDLQRDELVLELISNAKALRASMIKFKSQCFGDIGAFVDLSAEKYGVTMGGKKGNLTLYSYDGQHKVQIAIADRLVFDERLKAAKHLIDECIIDWSAGSDDKIKVLVQSAFDTDKEGTINTGRVLALRRLEITDPKWQMAMKAIGESLQVVGCKEYVRFYERIGAGKYEPISLDIAAV